MSTKMVSTHGDDGKLMQFAQTFGGHARTLLSATGWVTYMVGGDWRFARFLATGTNQLECDAYQSGYKNLDPLAPGRCLVIAVASDLPGGLHGQQIDHDDAQGRHDLLPPGEQVQPVGNLVVMAGVGVAQAHFRALDAAPGVEAVVEVDVLVQLKWAVSVLDACAQHQPSSTGSRGAVPASQSRAVAGSVNQAWRCRITLTPRVSRAQRRASSGMLPVRQR